MKKNLIKLLALTCSTVGLSACNLFGPKAPKAEEISLDLVFDYDPETYLTVYEGKLVTFEATVQGYTADKVYVQYCNGDYVSNIYVVECAADPTGFKFMDNVSVKGTVKTVNGRITIDEATITMVEEFDVQKGETDDDYYTSHAAYYAGTLSETAYEQAYSIKRYSGLGVIFEGVIASKPEAITTTSGSEFYVAFPGGNTDLEDEENEDLLKVTLPAGLSEAHVAKINTFFAGAEVNEGVTFFADLYWDNGMGFQFTNTNDKRTKVGAYDIITTWSAALEKGVSTVSSTLAVYWPDDYADALAALSALNLPASDATLYTVSGGVTSYYYQQYGIYLGYFDITCVNGTISAADYVASATEQCSLEFEESDGEYSVEFFTCDTGSALLLAWEDEGVLSFEIQFQFVPTLAE